MTHEWEGQMPSILEEIRWHRGRDKWHFLKSPVRGYRILSQMKWHLEEINGIFKNIGAAACPR